MIFVTRLPLLSRTVIGPGFYSGEGAVGRGDGADQNESRPQDTQGGSKSRGQLSGEKRRCAIRPYIDDGSARPLKVGAVVEI